MKEAVIICFFWVVFLSVHEAQGLTTNATGNSICELCECVVQNSTADSNITLTHYASVNCTKRSISEIPGWMEIPAYMDVLDLSDNDMTYARITGGGSRVRVEKLLLHMNNIARIAEPDFYNVEGLQILDLSLNNIVEIVGRPFLYIKKLKSLNLSANVLRDVPEGVFSFLTELQELSLSRNPIHYLGKNVVSKLSSLIHLDLSHTALSDIHRDAFKGCDNLGDLNLAWNNLETFPTRAFENLNQLVFLKLTGNPIHTIDQSTFWFPTSLVEIDLDQMPKLDSVRTNAFSRQASLIKVNISNNKMLYRFDAAAFRGAQAVNIIDLSGNKLSTIENGLELSILCSDSRLDLSSNPWHCDCHLTWTRAFSSCSNASLGACALPNSMQGFQINLLTEEQLTCEEDLWLFGIGTIDRRLGLVLLCLGVVGTLLGCCGIFLLIRFKPRITWNRRVKDKNQDICYLRMQDRDPEKLKPRRY